MSGNNWRAFGNEFSKCVDDVFDNFDKMPRTQRMFCYRVFRRALREEERRQARDGLAPVPNTRKKTGKTQNTKRRTNANARSPPKKKTMGLWTPRK